MFFAPKFVQCLGIFESRPQLVEKFKIFGASLQLAIDLSSKVGIVPEVGPARLGLELWTSQKEFLNTQVHPRFVDPTMQVGKFVGKIPHAP